MEEQHRDIDYHNNLEMKPYIGAIVLVVTFIVLGTVGNVHVLFVYTFRMKDTSHRIFIIVLAMLDLLSCTISMPFITADMFKRLTFTATTACRILRFFLYFFAGSSGFLLLPIAVDRYLKACRPFGEQVTPARAKVLCVIILVVGALSFWPAPVLYGHSSVGTPDPNITGISCYLDDKFKGSLYLAYWNGIMMIMIGAVFFGLIVLYYMIGRSIRTHTELKNKLLDNGKTNKVTGKSPTLTYKQKPTDAPRKQKNKDKHLRKEHYKLNIYRVYDDRLDSENASVETSFGTDNESNIDATENAKTATGKDQDGSLKITSIGITMPTKQNNDEEKGICENREGIAIRTDHVNSEVKVDKLIDDSDNEIKDSEGKGSHRNHCNDIKTNDKETVNNETNSNSDEQNALNQEMSRKHQEALRHIKRSKRTTQMFFAITILYFITFIPHLILQLITVTQDNFVAGLSFTGQTVYHIVFYCSFLNSMVNCYVYGFFDTLFRNELKRLYTGKCTFGRKQ